MADIRGNIREWLVRVFSRAIGGVSNEDDRHEIADWLVRSRDILAGDGTKREKFVALYGLMDARKTVRVFAHSVTETVKNYKNTDLPLPVKIAIPVTLFAAPFVGGQGAGVAAIGGAIGLPVLLLIFLGSAGITAVLESFTTHKDSAPLVMTILGVIAEDEIARRASAAMKAAMRDDPIEPKRHKVPSGEDQLRQKLLAMDPFEFERHVVSFFSDAGMVAWVTRKSNDFGVDGFARHDDGLLVIQCKRYAPDNPVSSAQVREFKGVIEENGAARGYLVTTSRFTADAVASAGKSDCLLLIDGDGLIGWHSTPPVFTCVSPS